MQIAFVRDDFRIPHHIDYLRRKTRAMLRRHWPKVDHVARALLDVKTLTNKRVNALIAKKTTSHEREIARRIDAVRKPDRDRYLAIQRFRQNR
jgi:hypothetical protein